MKYNILFLASWFPSQKNIYDGDFIERHAKAVSKIHNVTIIFVISLDKITKIKREETQEEGLKMIKIYFPKKNKIKNQWNKFKLYIKEIKKHPKFDLVHVNVTYPVGIIALYLKSKYKIPYVITEHWTGYLPQDPAIINPIQLYLTKQIVEHASYLLPVSESLGNAMKNLNLNCKTKVIRNTVNFNIFKNNNIKSSDVKKFLHISNLTYQKNTEGILNVSKRLWMDGYNFELHMGGNGDLKKHKEFFIQFKLSEKLFLFGELSQREVSEKMNKADIFILFSRFENQPCVQIESFACGLPVIATNVGGINEVFPSNFGKIIDSENEEQLYSLMKAIIKNEIQFKGKEEIHQFAIKNFSTEKIANDFDEVYNNVIK